MITKERLGVSPQNIAANGTPALTSPCAMADTTYTGMQFLSNGFDHLVL